MAGRSPQMVLDLLKSRPVVELQDLCDALSGASRATVFRHLSQVPYRCSYNHNGRYYALHDPARYDRFGLFSHGDIHFSADGTLKATVQRLVRESEAGWIERELRELLRVRVQPFLLCAVRDSELARVLLDPGYLYLYLHADPEVGRAQVKRRREQIEAAAQGVVEVSDRVAIRVLLVLVGHPGFGPADVVWRLQGLSPPVSLAEVRAVFARYDLGEKGGPSIF